MIINLIRSWSVAESLSLYYDYYWNRLITSTLSLWGHFIRWTRPVLILDVPIKICTTCSPPWVRRYSSPVQNAVTIFHLQSEQRSITITHAAAVPVAASAVVIISLPLVSRFNSSLSPCRSCLVFTWPTNEQTRLRIEIHHPRSSSPPTQAWWLKWGRKPPQWQS